MKYFISCLIPLILAVPASAGSRAEPGARSHAPESEQPQPEAARGAPEASSEASPENPVKVISWRFSDSQVSGDLEIQGYVQNRQPDRHIVMDLRVFVRWFDGQGNLLDSTPATLDALSLAPTSTAKFRATLPGASGSSVEPRFDVHSRTIKILRVVDRQ